MRFETRHQDFKKYCCTIRKFINILYALAMRHQQLQWYYNLDKSDFHGEELEAGPGESTSSEMIPGLTPGNSSQRSQA